MQLFVDFTEEYNKVYSSGEERKRRAQIFFDNLNEIKGLNDGDRFHPYGINEFADMSEAEFSKTHLMSSVQMRQDMNSTSEERRERSITNLVDWVGPIPRCFDWRDRTPSVVTSVKDQGSCGSCYSFAAVAQMETAWALQGHHPLVELSTQQGVSCDKDSYGCNGGFTWTFMSYVQSTGGLEKESTYPYQSGGDDVTRSCRFSSSRIHARFSGWHRVTRSNPTADDEYDMMVYLYRRGPISVCFNAKNLKSYVSRIMSNCGHKYSETTHCVVLTGFGVTASGTPYWVARNSWGPYWGDGGYFYIERNVNMCGVADYAYAAYINP